MSENRFWAKIDVRGPDECWPWMGSRDEKGYGHYWENGKVVKAHRKSWKMATGKRLLRRRKILHSCDNPPCQNPAHLFPGTNQDNCLDCGSKGRHWTQVSGNEAAKKAFFGARKKRPPPVTDAPPSHPMMERTG